MRLSDNALTVLGLRYLQPGETPEQRFRAVAHAVASAEDTDKDDWEEIYYGLMDQNLFLPNSPVLINYGVPGRPQQGSACFVLDVKDDLSNIFDVMRIAALISKSGGGNGFNFSSLRPAGSAVGGTGGVSSGPISFIKVYDAATESVKQGGVRKGANMGILEVWHPDIVEFIKCKAENGILKNFNLSVGVSESFFEAVEKDTDWELFWINKNGQKEVSKFIKARDLFSLIVEYAHKNGEPGMVFMDRLQAANVVPSVPIKATNPCGEQPLPAWSSCVLGSINLSEFVVNGEINWEHLREVIRHATRFLDNIVTVNEYPVPIIKEKHDEQRRIGLGVTGLADLLIKLGLPYGSKEGRELAKGIMEFINVESHAYSVELGQERGSFPLFEQSTWYGKVPAMRNAATTTIAPTGTLTTILGTEAYGAEPMFGPGYIKTVMNGVELPAMSQLFVETAKREGFYTDELMLKIAKTGTANQPEVPIKWRKVFAGANEISYADHIAMMSVLQDHVDAGISKTINMASDATVHDVRNAYWQVFKSGNIKGITIYRDGSRDGAPISAGLEKKADVESVSTKTVEPRPRPVTTTGITTQFKTGCGKMYLTVNKDENGLCETFARTGSNGGCAGLTEGISRIISLCLRSDIDPALIADQLCSVECKVSMRKDGALGKSCPDAIGKVIKQIAGIDTKKATKAVKDLKLEEAMEALEKEAGGCASCSSRAECKGEPVEIVEVAAPGDDDHICELCGAKMRSTEGCWACECGNSHCG